MNIKNGFTFFAMLILLFSSMLSPAMAMKDKQITEITDQTVYEVVEAAQPVTPIDAPAEESYVYSIVEDAAITDKTEDTTPTEHIGIAGYTPNTTNSTLAIDNTTVSGYITRPNMSNPVDNATVTLSTPNNATFTAYCMLSNMVGSVQTSTTTNASGFYSLNISAQIMNAPCILTLNVTKTNYVANVTNITISATNITTVTNTITYPNGTTKTYQTNYSEGIFPDTNRTIQMHANITAAIATDLINEPYTNYNQTYNATVTVTNLGDIAADNVMVNLTATNSTLTAPTMVNIGTINGLSSGTQIFAVKAPDNTTTDILVTGVNATDADDSSVKTSFDSITIYTQQQAGGDDAELEVNVTTNATYLNATDDLLEINITAWNDGEATANDTASNFTIVNASGADYTSYFTIIGSSPASANITGGMNQSFLYNISTHTAPSGNYTIVAYANATDGNTGTGINSNMANATFYVNFYAPAIIITSPAEGSVKGPSALLSAYTDYNVTMCRYGKSSDPATNMTQINETHYSINTPAEITSGNVTYYVNCEDRFGHPNETSITWFADATGPDINLTSPAATTMNPGTIINFTLTDAMSNLSTGYWTAINTTTRLSIDSNIVDYSGSSAKTGYLTINTSAWKGNVTLRIWANDTWNNTNGNITSGSMNITTEINITVDDIPPNVIINSPIADAWFGNSVYVNSTVTDNLSPAANLTVVARWVNSTNSSIFGIWTNLTNVAGTDYFTGFVNTTGLPQDNYTISVKAADWAGNVNDTQTVSIQIDRTPPNVTIISPISGGNYSRDSITVIANVSDSESGINENATCTIIVPGSSTLGIYNASTGQCTGAIGVPSTSVPDFFTSSINVSISDNAGNIGYNDSVSFSVYTVPTGPTSGGSSAIGGGYVNNETPSKLNLNFTIEPSEAEVLSNETATFTVNIKNTGQTALNNVVIKIYNIAQGDYYTDPKGINLMKGQNGTLELLITPNSLATGTYVIDLRIGNDLFSRGGNITLKVTNVLDYMEKLAAEKSCNDAYAYLMNLSAQGINTSANENSVKYAFTKIAEGDYKTSAAICNAVLALTPDQIRGGATINPFTGFFINTFGPFVAGNLFWILIAAGIVLTSFLGRNQVAGWLAGFKPKGKNGKGGAAAKPAVKETPKAAPKPEAPKAIAPKPEEKKPEAPKKDEPTWKIEWK